MAGHEHDAGRLHEAPPKPRETLMTCSQPLRESALTTLPSPQMIEAVRSGRTPELPPGVPAALSALLRECWALDPTARPTAPDLVARIKPLKVTGAAHSFDYLCLVHVDLGPAGAA